MAPIILEGLRQAEDRIKNYQTEHMVVVTEDGTERGEKNMGTGRGRSRVGANVREDMIEQYHPILTHNHPPAVGMVALSYVDIYTGFTVGFSEVRAVNRFNAVHSVRFDHVQKQKRLAIGRIYMLIFKALPILALFMFLAGPLLMLVGFLMPGLWMLSGFFSTFGMVFGGLWLWFNLQPVMPIKLLLRLFREDGKVDDGSTMIGERLEVPPTWMWNDNGAGPQCGYAQAGRYP